MASTTLDTDSPVCPACGHIERDAWELDFGHGLDGDTETSCGSCGEDYLCSRNCVVTYSTSPRRRPNALDTRAGSASAFGTDRNQNR